MNLLVYRKRDYLELMGLPVFIKMGLFMAAVFISNIVQALTGFAGVMLSIPPTILLYGPDMAKAVINVICWLVCAYLMVKTESTSIKRTGTHHSLHAYRHGGRYLSLQYCGRPYSCACVRTSYCRRGA